MILVAVPANDSILALDYPLLLEPVAFCLTLRLEDASLVYVFTQMSALVIYLLTQHLWLCSFVPPLVMQLCATFGYVFTHIPPLVM